jgi:uncharacterized protein (TIGR02186 family)
MTGTMKRAGLFVLFLCSVPCAALADDLVAGVSQDQIQITSNYTGSDVVVFGAVESGSDNLSAGKPDVVVVVRGQDADMAVRKKARVAGIWINSTKITLKSMPAYYFVASTRALSQVASQQTLQLYQLGAGNVQAESASTPNRLKAEPYRQAVIAQRKRDHLFIEQPDGVEFLGSTLFRVHVPVPAGAPRGQYTVEVYVIRNGMVMSVQSTPLFVDQIGLERRLYKLAFSWPVTYGLAAVLMALLMGWLSALVFRQT